MPEPKTIRKASALVLLLTPVLFLLAWIAIYPSDGDPRNIRYILWKAGLYNMNPDHAIGTMIGDSKREQLVLGKTKKELENRFGFLLAPADVSPYLRGCYQASAWKDRSVLFVRNSPRMVVFTADRASELVLIKGC